jgi:hypothetical protein
METLAEPFLNGPVRMRPRQPRTPWKSPTREIHSRKSQGESQEFVAAEQRRQIYFRCVVCQLKAHKAHRSRCLVLHQNHVWNCVSSSARAPRVIGMFEAVDKHTVRKHTTKARVLVNGPSKSGHGMARKRVWEM